MGIDLVPTMVEADMTRPRSSTNKEAKNATPNCQIIELNMVNMKNLGELSVNKGNCPSRLAIRPSRANKSCLLKTQARQLQRGNA